MRTLRWFALLLALVAGLAPPAVAQRAASAAAKAAQTALARQPQLLETALGGLQATSGEGSHLYFVGFAGFGEQAVFKREVVAVRQLFDERFGTRGRSVALINHRTTLADTPLATLDNLEQALAQVGKVMDRKRDTLFLFLTSHGLKDLFAVVMRGLRLEPLTPMRLRAMLDNAGIENRVIVVSACHSGSFLPALSGPRSLVIAAAREDRTSFGCEDRRQWTYFGDAYFNRALREDTSFVRAFERASGLIDAWEQRQKLTPSLPQIAGGEQLPPRP
jgi:phosphoglycolate phosphatase-like HAD superfamily hydrolase